MIFDDVWDLELWSYMKNVLFDNGKGSKIIVIIRRELVVFFWREIWINNYVYKFKFFFFEKLWELFCKKVF